MIRFHVINQGDTHITDWEDEPIQFGSTATAATRVTELRKQFGPDAAIRTERDVTPPRKPQDWTRFSLAFGDGTIRFTNPVPLEDADKLAGQLAVDYPKAIISRKEWKA